MPLGGCTARFQPVYAGDVAGAFVALPFFACGEVGDVLGIPARRAPYPIAAPVLRLEKRGVHERKPAVGEVAFGGKFDATIFT